MPKIRHSAKIAVNAAAEVVFDVVAADLLAVDDDPDAMVGHRPLHSGPLREGFRWQQRIVHNRHVCRSDWCVTEVALPRVIEQTMVHFCADAQREVRKRTLEWDLVAAGNWDAAARAWAKLHPVSAARLRKRCDEAEPEAQADAFLAVAKRDKGRFAQALAELAESETLQLTLPPYLAEALAFIARRDEENDQTSQPSDAAGS
jgi:hypothetical protein